MVMQWTLIGAAAAALIAAASEARADCLETDAVSRWGLLQTSKDQAALSDFMAECKGSAEAFRAGRRLRALRRAAAAAEPEAVPTPVRLPLLIPTASERMRDANIERPAEQAAEAKRAWAQVTGTWDMRELEAFLEAYPASADAPRARQEIDALDAEVRRAQRVLRTLRLYGGQIDGDWGPASQDAYRRLQRERGWSPVETLLSRARVARLEEVAKSYIPPAPPPRRNQPPAANLACATAQRDVIELATSFGELGVTYGLPPCPIEVQVLVISRKNDGQICRDLRVVDLSSGTRRRIRRCR